MSFLKSISSSIKNVEAYVDAAVRAVSDGVLSDIEHSELKRIAINLKMTPTEINSAHRKVIERYTIWYLEDRVLTDNEASRLIHLCKLLEVEWATLDPNILGQVNRCIELQKVAQGQLPRIDPRSLPIQVSPSEVVHFAAHCAIYETRVVARASTGGYGGVRVRIAKGVSAGLGGYRGHSVPIRDSVCGSEGLLLLTSTHARYFGSSKGFQKPWSKVSGAQVFQDGLAFFFSDRTNASTLQFLDNADPALADAILNHMLA